MPRFTLTPAQTAVFRQLVELEVFEGDNPVAMVVTVLQLTNTQLRAALISRIDDQVAALQTRIDVTIDAEIAVTKTQLGDEIAALNDLKAAL